MIKETQLKLTNLPICFTENRIRAKAPSCTSVTCAVCWYDILEGLQAESLLTFPVFKRGQTHHNNMIGYREDRKKSDNEPIHTEKIFADRKIFFLDLKENDRGRFVKITEDVRGRRDTIMVPAEFLDEFVEALKNVQNAAAE